MNPNIENRANRANRANAETANGNTFAVSKQSTQSKHWCFTLNNWTVEELEQIEQIVQQCCDKWIIGKEVGEEGTPHLQGYIVFTVKVRFTQILSVFLNKRIHWEKCRNHKASAKYCGKEGDYIVYGFTKDEVTGYVKPIKYEGEDIVKVEEFYPWQTETFKLINIYDDRKVIWIYEGIGNVGKTSFAKYMGFYHQTLIVQKGKHADIMNMAFNLGQKLKSMIIDVPRSNGNKVSYTAIESIKSGIIINTKYETGQNFISPVRIIVFSNFPPDESQLSEDRWDIYEINEKKELIRPEENIDLIS